MNTKGKKRKRERERKEDQENTEIVSINIERNFNDRNENSTETGTLLVEREERTLLYSIGTRSPPVQQCCSLHVIRVIRVLKRLLVSTVYRVTRGN